MTKDLSMPFRSEILANGILGNCPRCKRDAYKLRSQGDWHYWCDYCSVNHDKANESASFLTAGVDVMSDRFEVAVASWDPVESPTHQQAIDPAVANAGGKS